MWRLFFSRRYVRLVRRPFSSLSCSGFHRFCGWKLYHERRPSDYWRGAIWEFFFRGMVPGSSYVSFAMRISTMFHELELARWPRVGSRPDSGQRLVIHTIHHHTRFPKDRHIHHRKLVIHTILCPRLGAE